MCTLHFGCLDVGFWLCVQWFGCLDVVCLADVRFGLSGRLILVEWTLDFGCMCNGFWLGGR